MQQNPSYRQKMRLYQLLPGIGRVNAMTAILEGRDLGRGKDGCGSGVMRIPLGVCECSVTATDRQRNQINMFSEIGRKSIDNNSGIQGKSSPVKPEAIFISGLP